MILFLIIAAVVVIGVLWLYLAGGGPFVHRTEIEIAARPEVVFRFLTEPALAMQWIEGLVESTPLTEGGDYVGARSRDVIVENGRRITMESEVTRIERPAVLDVTITARGIHITSEYRLTPRGDGMVLAVQERLTFRGAMRLLAPLATRGGERRLATMLDRLRVLAAHAR